MNATKLELVTAVPLCPICSSIMRLRNGKRGQFYGCSRFPKCKGTRDFIVDIPIKLLPGTPEQEAIFDFLKNGTENGLVQARAGVGKTWCIVNSIVRLRGVKIGVFSFNNHIIKEMNEQLQKEGINWARGYTYNSFGYRAIRNSQHLQGVELFEDKLSTIIMELCPDDTEEAIAIRNATSKLVRMCKYYLEDGKNEDVLTEMVDRFNIEINDDYSNGSITKGVLRVFTLVPKALDMCLKRRATLDFDDQIWWTVKMKLPVEKFDIVFIDEAQDTNRMQQELVKMACP